MSFKKRYNKRIESNMHAHAETADPISAFFMEKHAVQYIDRKDMQA